MGMVTMETADLSSSENSRIIKSIVNPRPIAWISTFGDDKTPNLAPYSAYNYVCSTRPVVMFSSYTGNNELKDSPRNALDSGDFAVNIVTESFAEQMDRTSADLAPEESEFEFAGIDIEDCERISAPRVPDVIATMECRVIEEIEIFSNLVIFGEVVYYHLSDDIFTDGEVDMQKIDTVGRLGGPYYTGADFLDLVRQF